MRAPEAQTKCGENCAFSNARIGNPRQDRHQQIVNAVRTHPNALVGGTETTDKLLPLPCPVFQRGNRRCSWKEFRFKPTLSIDIGAQKRA